MGKIERGRLVWLTNVIDSRGKPTEDHRAVILTTNADYEAGKPIQAAYISSKLNYSSEDRIVLLRHAKGGHPQTGLDRPSAVICDWRHADVHEDDITSYGNMIYGKTLDEVMTKLAKCSAEEADEKGKES